MADIIEWISKIDAKSRADASDRLVTMITVAGQLDDSQLSAVIGELNSWLKTSNFKVVVGALQAMKALTERHGEGFRMHIPEIMVAVRNLFTDSHDQVRDLVLDLLATLMSVASGQQVFEYLQPCFTHRAWRVRQTVLLAFEQALTKVGPAGLGVSKMIPTLCKLLADPNENVREAAMCALVEAYRHVGERVRTTVSRQDIRPNKLAPLFERFDAVQASGLMLSHDNEEQSHKATTSFRQTRPSTASSAAGARAAVGIARGGSARASTRKNAGGVDADEFDSMMSDCTPIHVASERDLEIQLRDVAVVVRDEKEADWEKRVSCLKTFRGIVAGNGPEFEAFVPLCLKHGEAWVAGISDLRSQVSRETCVMVSQIADALGERFEPLLTVVVPVLLRQVIINVKVLADSANLCMHHIVKSAYSPKLVSLLVDSRADKSNTLRRRVCEYMLMGLQTWDVACISRHRTTIAKYIAHALNDADAEVRKVARRTYWCLQSQFPDLGGLMTQDLDAFKLKLLNEVQQGTSSAKATTEQPARAKPRPRAMSVPHEAEDYVEEDRGARLAVKTPRGSGLSRSGDLSRTFGSFDDLHSTYPPAKPLNHAIIRAESAKPQRVRSEQPQPENTVPGQPRRVQSGTAARVSPLNMSSNMPRRVPQSQSRTPTLGTPVSSAPSSPRMPRAASAGSASIDVISDILTRSASTDWAQRNEAVALVRGLLTTPVRPAPRDLKKLADYFTRQFAEPHKKVFVAVIDALSEFVLRFADELSDAWLYDALGGLLLKLGSDPPLSTTSMLRAALGVIQDNFDFERQLLAMAKMLTDSKLNFNLKAKHAHCEYLATLLQQCTSLGLESVNAAAPSDFRSAVGKIIEFCSEPKSSELRKLSAHVIAELFELNPILFNRVLDALSPTVADAARKVLDVQVPGWEGMRQAGVADGFLPSERESGLRHNLHDSNDDLSESLGYNPSSYQDGHRSPARRTSQISVHGSAARLSKIPAPAAQHGALSSQSASPTAGLGGKENKTPQAQQTDEPESMTVIEPNKLTASTDDSTLGTLQLFVRMSKENPLSFWDKEFHGVLPVVLNLLRDSDAQIRETALKVLRELLRNQTKFFEAHVVFLIEKLFDCLQDTERGVLQSMEETLNVLANHISPRQAMDVLMPMVDQEDGPRLLAALKLLTKIIKFFRPEDLDDHISTLVPSLVKGYKHPLAEVRKAVVFTLVEMHLILGDSLRPHLGALSSSQTKLLNIYVKRAEERAQQGTRT